MTNTLLLNGLSLRSLQDSVETQESFPEGGDWDKGPRSSPRRKSCLQGIVIVEYS